MGAPDHWIARCVTAGSRFPPWHHSSDPAVSAVQHQEAGGQVTEVYSIPLPELGNNNNSEGNQKTSNLLLTGWAANLLLS